MYAIMCGSLKRSRDQWNLSNWCSVNFQEYLLHHINGWITIGHTNDSRFNPWCEIFSLNFSFFFDYQPVLILFGNALILKHLIIAMIMFWYCIMSVDALNSIVKSSITVVGSFNKVPNQIPLKNQHISNRSHIQYIILQNSLKIPSGTVNPLFWTNKKGDESIH